jgi:hypothetical protein
MVFGEKHGKTRNCFWSIGKTEQRIPERHCPARGLTPLQMYRQDRNDPTRTKMDVPEVFDYTWAGRPGARVADGHCGTTTFAPQDYVRRRKPPLAPDPPRPSNKRPPRALGAEDFFAPRKSETALRLPQTLPG